jgi:hypothetical protein
MTENYRVFRNLWVREDLQSESLHVHTNLELPDGSAASPALTFTNDTDSGLFRVGANTLALSVNGVEGFRLGSGDVFLGASPVHNLTVPGSLILTSTSANGLIFNKTVTDLSSAAPVLSNLTFRGIADQIIYCNLTSIASMTITMNFSNITGSTDDGRTCVFHLVVFGGNGTTKFVDIAAGTNLQLQGLIVVTPPANESNVRTVVVRHRSGIIEFA